MHTGAHQHERPDGATAPPPYPAPLEEALATIRPAWHTRAVCAPDHGELFFSDRATDQRRAKVICRTCPVRHDCLEYALTTGQQWGVWGGLTSKERDLVRRARRAV